MNIIMGNTVKVQEVGINQLTLTIPSALAQSMGIRKGDQVEWRVAGKNRLELHTNTND